MTDCHDAGQPKADGAGMSSFLGLVGLRGGVSRRAILSDAPDATRRPFFESAQTRARRAQPRSVVTTLVQVQPIVADLPREPAA
jgi:hypothetical protein